MIFRKVSHLISQLAQWLDYETKSNSTYMNSSVEKSLVDWTGQVE